MERDVLKGVQYIIIVISTHTLTWSVTITKHERGFKHEFQLTRSRGAWLANPILGSKNVISTHTLTWSVTFTWGNLPDTIDISTHTLTWSVTKNEYYSLKKINISTHTLTWSVTDWMWTFQRWAVFQLTRSRGAWHFNGIYGKGTENFNSHAHVERDDILSECLNAGEDFNSHAHVERDTHFITLAL